MRAAGVVVCFSMAAAVWGCATAPPLVDEWVLLGEPRVDFRIDHDVIEVGRHAGRFSELRFVARGGEVEMRNMRVVLGDGDSFSPDSRLVLERGEAHFLHLPGGGRVVRRVEFVYRSLREDRRRATIFLYGR